MDTQHNPNTGTALVPTGDDYIAQAVTELQAVDGKQRIDEAINQLQERYGSLTVSDLNDRPAYIAAVDGAKLVKKLRTGVESKRKELNEFPLKFQRAVNAEAKRITEALTPLEAHLKAQVDKFEKAEEEAKKAEQAAKHKALIESGWQFNGSFYVCGPISMTVHQAMELTEERFAKALQHGADELARQEAERVRREEEAKRQAEEAERLRQEQEQLRREKEEMRTSMMAMAGCKLVAGEFILPETKGRYGYLSDIVQMQNSQFTALIERVQDDKAKALEPAPMPEAVATAVEKIQERIEVKVVQPEDSLLPEREDVWPAVNLSPFEPTAHSSEYIDGYEHCRAAVLELFADGVQRKRSEFIEAIKALKA